MYQVITASNIFTFDSVDAAVEVVNEHLFFFGVELPIEFNMVGEES